jgi:hypothetical protein
MEFWTISFKEGEFVVDFSIHQCRLVINFESPSLVLVIE